MSFLPSIAVWNRLILLVFSAFVATTASRAQDASRDLATNRGVEDVGNSITERNQLDQLFGNSLLGTTLEPWDEWREQFFKEINLELRLAYDAYAQSYLSESSTSGFAGDLTLDGRWFLLGEKVKVPTHLGFRVRYRHAIGGRPPSEIGEEIGAFWGTIRGFNAAGLEIPDFFIEQQFLDERLDLRLGQMNIRNLFDGHAMQSSKRAFANRAFSESPGVAFPSYGAGGFLRWDDDNDWDVSLGIANVQGTTEANGSDQKFFREELFYGLQFGGRFDGWNREEARLQLLAWYSDPLPFAGQPRGRGLSFTYEQELDGDRERIFARYAYETGGATSVDHILALGYGKSCGDFDELGAALGVGRSNNTDQWQWVAEVFYRWRPWREIVIHPTLQILYGDGFVDGNGPHIIAGLHGQISF